MLQGVIGKWNDQATLEARGQYSAEIGRLQKAHARQCEAMQAQHDGVCQQIRTHNEAIWPQVTIAKAAQEELDRVEQFIEHIRLAPVAVSCNMEDCLKCATLRLQLSIAPILAQSGHGWRLP